MPSRFSCLFITAMLLATGCKKENNQPPSLTGTWELRIVYNGMGGQTAYPAGNGKTVVFTGNHYSGYINGFIDSGTYKTVKDASFLSGNIENRIIYNGNKDGPHSLYRLNNDSLNIWLDAYDTGGSLYIKK